MVNVWYSDIHTNLLAYLAERPLNISTDPHPLPLPKEILTGSAFLPTTIHSPTYHFNQVSNLNKLNHYKSLAIPNYKQRSLRVHSTNIIDFHHRSRKKSFSIVQEVCVILTPNWGGQVSVKLKLKLILLLRSSDRCKKIDNNTLIEDPVKKKNSLIELKRW